jgi:hypothetical protein
VSRPGRGVVDEETCPIVRARGCSAGFIGTGVLSAAPPKFRPDQSGAVLGASALSRAHINRGSHFVQVHSLACSRSVNIVLLVTNFFLSF